MGHRENGKIPDWEPNPAPKAHVSFQTGIKPCIVSERLDVRPSNQESHPKPTPVPTPTPRSNIPFQAGIRLSWVLERREFGMHVRRMIKMVQKAVLNPGEPL